MTRFYFQVHDGRSSPDEVGTLMGSREDARREALRRSVILLRVTQSTSMAAREGWTVAVTDETGDLVCQIDAAPGVLSIH